MCIRDSYCLDALVEIEHDLRIAGVFQEYQNYKVWTRMLVFGKQKLEELKQSLLDVREEYEYVNEDGTVEKWKLPKSTDEVKSDIKEMIENGTNELKELESKRNIAFDVLKEKNYEHYI